MNDRAGDIWEPLLALADLAGGSWPELARQAAVGLSVGAQEHSPMSTLLFDIGLQFVKSKDNRIFSRDLVAGLNGSADRPWAMMRPGNAISEIWLPQQLRPYGIRPRTIRSGASTAKGYIKDEFTEIFRRCIPRSAVEAYLAASGEEEPPPASPAIARKPAMSNESR